MSENNVKNEIDGKWERDEDGNLFFTTYKEPTDPATTLNFQVGSKDKGKYSWWQKILHWIEITFLWTIVIVIVAVLLILGGSKSDENPNNIGETDTSKVFKETVCHQFGDKNDKSQIANLKNFYILDKDSSSTSIAGYLKQDDTKWVSLDPHGEIVDAGGKSYAVQPPNTKPLTC